MPSNQQRREAARRKLERQLVRRQERARSRRQRLLVVGVVAAVLVVAGVVWFVTTRKSTPAAADSTDTSGSDTAASSSSAPATPCTYTTEGAAKAVKSATVPANLSPANTGSVAVQMTVNGQQVPITLNRAEAPCAVNSFLSLASQGFYNSTDCWRLTASGGLNILQCGDPSGKGNGGPGYTFASEVTATTKYPVGTIAMANAGADTNGSQFFIVYKASTLSPSYTAFGTVTADGMKVIDAIAAKGVTKNLQEGAPVQKATIESVTVPSGVLEATGSYPSTAASPTAEATDGESAGAETTGASSPAGTASSTPAGSGSSSVARTGASPATTASSAGSAGATTASSAGSAASSPAGSAGSSPASSTG